MQTHHVFGTVLVLMMCRTFILVKQREGQWGGEWVHENKLGMSEGLVKQIKQDPGKDGVQGATDQ